MAAALLLLRVDMARPLAFGLLTVLAAAHIPGGQEVLGASGKRRQCAVDHGVEGVAEDGTAAALMTVALLAAIVVFAVADRRRVEAQASSLEHHRSAVARCRTLAGPPGAP